MPGRAFVRSSPIEPDWRLNRVLLNGADVTDVAVDVPVGGTLEVVVELTDHFYPVSGKVSGPGLAALVKRLLHRGGFVRDCQVIIFGQDPKTWSPGMRNLAAMRPDVDGVFRATLPAGNYFAVATPDMERGIWNDPRFLTKARARATRFTIAPDQPEVVNLKLARAPAF